MENSTPIQKTKVFRVKVDLEKGISFEELCKNENTNVNAKLKELVDFSLKQKKFFLAGKNNIKYNKSNNTFEWSALLDNGKSVPILDNLSDAFIKDLKKEIELAIQERNDWAHQKDNNSVAFPVELVGGEK